MDKKASIIMLGWFKQDNQTKDIILQCSGESPILYEQIYDLH